MGTISVKHFLNKNLKPYMINGTAYYSIYVLVTAQRKTTKFKSLTFTEYYSEQDFNELMNSPENKTAIDNELTSIKRIAEIIIAEIGVFDTMFFTAYVNFSKGCEITNINIDVLQTETDIAQTFGKKSILGISVRDVLPLCDLFEFYGIEQQTELKKQINTISDKDFFYNKKISTDELMQDINNLIFVFSMPFFQHYIRGRKKSMDLILTYLELFLEGKEILSTMLMKKYTIRNNKKYNP